MTQQQVWCGHVLIHGFSHCIFIIPQVTNTENKLMELNEAMAKEKKSYQKEKAAFGDSLVCAWSIMLIFEHCKLVMIGICEQ